ncbi:MULTISPECIES: ABC transporter substrate-binding protein [unclassified Rathayibacter]|uniref:ABC transporter substrate-binding protein n=1 Tax=unclassified Rathayibacter TaxID=2609250 RepID=UPI000F904030|nr:MULTISPECIES: extracellular solute-binding protein [unclassified Rathayibacter]MCJ1704871.1 extracellular solute-binding protein [Rathayibacter sp. VKM Ac-2926]ROP57636.1 putative spermidine/putrescine transport system substrate-binding protein [Rathayibacter sp. PhB186]ROS56021.1 putative spermidine/putrescine transport system substrate-binding protein [Rathayibacter sp. PhB185]TCL84513.1 putative spermidine/putrescine transport system substrate-binding protein [Rathayibacter sp. PhB192]TC
MTTQRFPRAGVLAAAAAALALTLTACSGDAGASSGDASVDASTATSAADLGGLDALVEAAKAEGELNVIALPDNWANYGELISGFEDEYGITVNSADPDVSSAEEISTAQNLAGQDTAPDVFDLGAAVALANTDLFAPYKVETWDDIPEGNREETGLWVNDYTGLMSIGYDADAVPAPESLDDLLGADYRGSVAINGDPTQAGAAAAAVQLAALQSGGSADDVQSGIDFFEKLNDAGNFLPLDPTDATIASGETPVVFDWSYNNLAAAKANEGTREWTTTVLPGTAVGSYYNQAINADAPHPAAARLWQEYLYSDAAQNLYLAAGAYPVRLAAMVDAGTVDTEALDAVGAAPEDLVQFTSEQTEAASALLAEKWGAAIQ